MLLGILRRVSSLCSNNLSSSSGKNGFPGGSVVKNLPANAGYVSLISGSGRSLGEGNGSSLQYFCLENSKDRGAWKAAVQGLTRVGNNLVTKQQPGRKSLWTRKPKYHVYGFEYVHTGCVCMFKRVLYSVKVEV